VICELVCLDSRSSFRRGQKPTFSKHPYPTASTALLNGLGNSGENASRFFFSHPSGAVITTSSKNKLSLSPVSVPTVSTATLPSTPLSEAILATLLLNLMSAPDRAGFAILSRIFS
jgi:hypothetical protein